MSRASLPWILVVLLVGIAIYREVPLAAQEPGGARGADVEVTPILRARRLEIVDEHGRGRIVLDVQESGVARIEFAPQAADEPGRAYWHMRADGHAEIAAISPGADAQYVRVGSLAKGVPAVVLGNQRGSGCEICMHQPDGASMAFLTPGGKGGIGIQLLGPENESVLTLSDRRGVGTFRLSLLQNGTPALRVGSGSARAAFRLEPDESKSTLQFVPLDLKSLERR